MYMRYTIAVFISFPLVGITRITIEVIGYITKNRKRRPKPGPRDPKFP
jgi:hypothetical protein